MHKQTTHGLIAALAAFLLLLSGCGSPQNSAESGAAPTSTATADSEALPIFPPKSFGVSPSP